VAAHQRGHTPNPCIECNRSIKFDRLLERTERLGFDVLATGHHARVTHNGVFQLRRGADPDKDQSYVLSMLGQGELARVTFPVGEMTKAEVRLHASRLGLRTADKPDSQDVCFINSTEGREGFLSRKLEFHPGEVVNGDGESVGSVEAIELVTVGQRRGMGHGTDGQRRYVVAVDMPTRRVTVGSAAEAVTSAVMLSEATVTWVDRPLSDGDRAVAQVSAHGRPAPCSVRATGAGLVALYDVAAPDTVVGAGIAA